MHSRLLHYALVLMIIVGLAGFAGYRLMRDASCEQLSEDTCLILERATTPEARERGLSGRGSLPPDRAMLFVFENDAQHSIWMKDMRFSIDIVWLDSEKRVIHQELNVSPSTYPTSFQPETNARYVLEKAPNTTRWQNGEVLHFSTN